MKEFYQIFFFPVTTTIQNNLGSFKKKKKNDDNNFDDFQGLKVWLNEEMTVTLHEPSDSVSWSSLMLLIMCVK